MIKQFYLLCLSLSLLIVGVVVHYSYFDRSSMIHGYKNLTTATQMPLLSLSVSYIESDGTYIFSPKVYSNTAYPQMQRVDRMEFVYER